MFSKSDYVFVLHQEKFLVDEDEKSLRKEADEYINSKLKGLFGKKIISYTDIFTEGKTMTTVNVLSTITPATSIADSKKSKYVLSIIYQVWAYVKLNDEKVFSSEYIKKTFESEKITVYIFKV